MGRKVSPGLFKRGELWHVDKQIFGIRIRESTGTHLLCEAEKFLNFKVEQLRQALIYGVRPKRIFRVAATQYLIEKQHKATIARDGYLLQELNNYIGDLPLDEIHMGSLQPYILARKKAGVKTRTINYGLQVVRHLLNLAAGEWIDEQGLTWLAHAPKIKLLSEHDKRKPYPLNWDEQQRLLQALPSHLTKMALFAVNTGCRDREVCGLRWEWEVPVPDLPGESVFIIPGEHVKNREDRLVVLNRVARSVIESMRGKHDTFVFVYRGKPIARMLNSGWKHARARIGLAELRVHDLKHTFGRRLRAAGVSFEDRQDLLGHKSSRVTTHYSCAELQSLLFAANKVCAEKGGTPIAVLRVASQTSDPHKISTSTR